MNEISSGLLGVSPSDLLGGLVVGIVVLNDSLEVQWTNDSFADILGFEVNELLKLPLSSVVQESTNSSNYSERIKNDGKLTINFLTKAKKVKSLNCLVKVFEQDKAPVYALQVSPEVRV